MLFGFFTYSSILLFGDKKMREVEFLYLSSGK